VEARNDASRHDPLRDRVPGLKGGDELGAWFLQVRRFGRIASVALAEVNGLAYVNDQLGHSFGDAVMEEVARRVVTAAPDDVSVGRVAVDGFALWSSGPVAAQLEAIVKGVGCIDLAWSGSDAVGAVGGDRTLSVHLGVGTARGRAGDEDLPHLLDRADEALDRACQQVPWPHWNGGTPLRTPGGAGRSVPDAT
jgi:diguanylate cyclase (GGDEF)-like protein